MTVSPPQTRQTYQDGRVRGIQDARLLAEGLQPRGAGVPLAYPYFSFHRGYRDGLAVPVTPIQRASSATEAPREAPWRAARSDHDQQQRHRPGPWQIANVGPDRHDLWPGRES